MAKSRKRSTPENLVDDEGHPTHEWWYQDENGQEVFPPWHEKADPEKRCYALQVIEKSERLALDAWPWEYSVVSPEVAIPKLQNTIPDTCLPDHSGLSDPPDWSAPDHFLRSALSVPLKWTQKETEHYVLPRPEWERKWEKPWTAPTEAQRMREVLRWLHEDEDVRVQPEEYWPLARPPRTLSGLAYFRPDILVDARRKVRRCNVLCWDVRGSFGKEAEWLHSYELHACQGMVGRFTDSAAKTTQVHLAYRELMEICDIQVRITQGEILGRAQKRLDELGRQRTVGMGNGERETPPERANVFRRAETKDTAKGVAGEQPVGGRKRVIPDTLRGWHEICEALRRQHGFHRTLKRLSERYGGPIKSHGPGKLPTVSESKLLEWWGKLEQGDEEDEKRQAEEKAALNAEFRNPAKYGPSGAEYFPDSGTHIKKKRK